MKLSDDIVAGLKLPAGRTEHFIWDDALPGFGVRLRAGAPSVVKRWYVQYRIGRQQRRESLGDTRKIRLDQARKIARNRFAQVELGKDPAGDRIKAMAESTAAKLKLGMVADRYLAARVDLLRPSTYGAAARYLQLHWAGLRNQPIGTIKRADIAAVLQEIITERGRVSAARARANLSALFGWAIREGLCDTNPVIATNDPSAGIQARDRILDDGEIRQVWGACLDDSFGRIVKLLLLTGCRRQEIGDLRWDEINLDTGVMTIPGNRTKSRKTLVLTLPPLALDILVAAQRRKSKLTQNEGSGSVSEKATQTDATPTWQSHQPYVFGEKGSAGYNAWAYGLLVLSGRIAAAGRPLQHWTLHDLRRSMRSGLGQIGVQPHIAERAIGHAVGKIEAVYDRHTYAAEIKTALLRWADHVASILEDQPSNVVALR